MEYRQVYRVWTQDGYFDEDTRRELLAVAGDEKEIEDRFYRHLEFGTAGLRGVIGAGTNRMNVYTVRRVTQGLADAVNAEAAPGGPPAVAVAFDTRRMSRQFAMETASVLAANAITAHLFQEVMPTPVLSYAVRRLRCDAGVMITASHNPSQYNGYKVYSAQGGQIAEELARFISERIDRVEPVSRARTMEYAQAVAAGRIRLIGGDVLEAYAGDVLGLRGEPAAGREALRVVYTPLHGAGLVPVARILERAGFPRVTVVPEQREADPDFPTVKAPNPEERAALDMAVELAGRQRADLVIATDADGDRLGVACRNRKGGYDMLTGNQVGCLLMDYRLGQAAAAGALTGDDYVVKTIVTTEMARAIAAGYGVRMEEVLTGFKYIAQVIEHNRQAGRGRFQFGFEESYGYLAGEFVRDKDAVIAAMLACEAAAAAKREGRTLSDRLRGLFEKYGWYRERVVSHTCRGRDGLEQMRAIMSGLRAKPPVSIGGMGVAAVRDYLTSRRTAAGGAVTPLDLPVSDVLYFEMEDGAWMAVRPSGTEPKIKIYTGVRGATEAGSLERDRTLARDAARLMEAQDVP